MKIITVILSAVVCSSIAHAQPNCEVYKMNGDQQCYEACLLAVNSEAGQGYRHSQLSFDRAIELCPTFDWAYMEKAVPYLKRGDFITWRRLIDEAVRLNSRYLGYRGWCRYQFLRDYEGALQDLDLLDSLTQFDLGYCQNGDYHLNVTRALCYKGMGLPNKAAIILEQQLQSPGYVPLPYDYLHLGVIKMELNKHEEAILWLKKSIGYNDYLAEPYYYLGIIYRHQGRENEAMQSFSKAKEYYLKGFKRTDPYTHPMDKVFLGDIEVALSKDKL